jgi:F-type H+-transporting ATPase subunit epsilon
MARSTHFAVITPREVKREGEAEIVVAPGAAGDLAALIDHAPLLTTLRVGIVSAALPGERIEFAVDGGFLQILPNKVIVLTDTALAADEVDEDVARADLLHAEERLAQKHGGDDAAERHAVAWAHARLDVRRRKTG